MLIPFPKLTSIILLIGLALRAQAAQVQSLNVTQLQQQILQLSECPQNALSLAVDSSGCSLDDHDCLCSSAVMKTNLELFLTTSCTIKETLQTQNLTSRACAQPVRDRGAEFILASTILVCFSGLLVLQRIVFKLATRLPLCADDWTILGTFLVGLPGSIINVHGITPAGLGRDIWTLRFAQIDEFFKYFYVCELVYFVEVALVKLAMLLFFLRIFPGPRVRRLLWVTIAFTSLYGLSFALVGIFQCQPITFFWRMWDNEHEGSCLNINAIAWANAIISILLDVWMLAIPLWQLKGLQLDWKKKLGVGMMFSVAAFITIVSILRLRSLVSFTYHLTNPTYDYFDVVMWSAVEINVGIICVCLPTLRLLLVTIWPKLASPSTLLSSRRRSLSRLRTSKVMAAAPRGHVPRPSQSWDALRASEEASRQLVPKSAPKLNDMVILYQQTFMVEFDENGDEATLHEVDSSLEKPASVATRATAWASRRPSFI